jgi:hypothetical protein
MLACQGRRTENLASKSLTRLRASASGADSFGVESVSPFLQDPAG